MSAFYLESQCCGAGALRVASFLMLEPEPDAHKDVHIFGFRTINKPTRRSRSRSCFKIQTIDMKLQKIALFQFIGQPTIGKVLYKTKHIVIFGVEYSLLCPHIKVLLLLSYNYWKMNGVLRLPGERGVPRHGGAHDGDGHQQEKHQQSYGIRIRNLGAGSGSMGLKIC
jgi:hypothetical protein